MSTEHAWTPDPWRAVEAKLGHDRDWSITAAGRSVMAEIYERNGLEYADRRPDEAAANARLMASAPQLYEALDALLSLVRARQLSPIFKDDGNGFRVVDVDAMTYADTVLAISRTALADATGKTK